MTGFVDTSEPSPSTRPTEAPEQETPARAEPSPFGPPEGTEWKRVSRALAWYRRCVAGALCLAGGALGAFLAFLWGDLLWAVSWAGAALVVFVVYWPLAGIFHRSWGYAESESELHLTHGVFLRQLIVVPYGRMQVVDVTADLLEQALGMATVRVRTAASAADTRVVGLPLEEAVRLRGRLAARSESFSTGL